MKRVLFAMVVFALARCVFSADPLPDSGKYQVTINNTAKVELLAVSNNWWEYIWEHKTKPARINNHKQEYWWKPDGELMKSVPFKRAVFSSGEHFDYVLRVSGIDGDYSLVAAMRETEDLNHLFISDMETWDGKPIKDVKMVGVTWSYRSPIKKTGLRVGIAYGPWMKLDRWEVDDWTEWATQPESHILGSSSGALIELPQEKKGNLEVDLAHTRVQDQIRLVAFDQAGKEYVANMRDRGNGNGISRRLCVFKGLTLKDLKSIEVQLRNYQWAQIPDINVDPEHVAPYKKME